jgi:hypothetical protein
MPPAVCEIEAAAGSFDFGRLAPYFAQDAKQSEEPKDDTQNEGPKTVEQEQIILALFLVSLLAPSLYFPGLLLSDSLLCQA